MLFGERAEEQVDRRAPPPGLGELGSQGREDERRRKGTLEREDESLYDRCDRLVKRLKGLESGVICL